MSRYLEKEREKEIESEMKRNSKDFIIDKLMIINYFCSNLVLEVFNKDLVV